MKTEPATAPLVPVWARGAAAAFADSPPSPHY